MFRRGSALFSSRVSRWWTGNGTSGFLFDARGSAGRRLGGLRAGFIVAALLLCGTGLAPADEVADYLEEHGLRQLLSLHLENQLEAAGPEEREQLIIRLAGLYAALLEQVDDPVRRRDIEQRSRQLLTVAPESSVAGLRLALLRATYRAAERTAENHRLRLSTPEELSAAKRALTDILPDLHQLDQQIQEDIEVLDRRLSRSSGSEAVALAEDVDRLKGLAAQCAFLRAWALYYQSWLHERPDNAKIAQQLFAELLDPEQPFVNPEDVSVDLRGLEAVARSILGLALCKSMTASTPTAIAWVELLENERTFEPLRAQAPIWKIVIYLENDDPRSALSVLEAYRRSGDTIPLQWLRLIAVQSLELARDDSQARPLVDLAVTELASRSELQQILDLAARYGPEALGDSGFALQYVNGVLAYHEAQRQHEGDQPTTDPKIRAMYAQALELLQRSLLEPDATAYPEASAASRRLIAWCLYFRSDLLEARRAFEQAAASLVSDEAADALWMAIVCLDRLNRAGGSESLRLEQRELTQRFLEEYPASVHAPKLILRQAIASEQATEEQIDLLLAIPPNSEVHREGRLRAADMLYQLFRDGQGEDRIGFGNRYLAVAAPMVLEDAATIAAASELDRQRLLIRCRRLLEVALASGIERHVVTQQILVLLDGLQRDGAVDLTPYRDELDEREVRLLLLTGEPEAAASIADRLWDRDRSSVWARLASKRMFAFAHDLWQASQPDSSAEAQGLEYVVRYGERMLTEFEGRDAAARGNEVVGYYAAVAEASQRLWERSGDAERGARALALYADTLLPARPDNARFLRSTAVLAERFGDPRQALDAWRRLVAGSETGSDAWYEAKFKLISILAGIDAERARAVMDQYRQLNPDYGPEPWGPRMKALDRQIDALSSGRGDSRRETTP